MTDKEERYYLYRIAEIIKCDERRILDYAKDGLVFSMFFELAEVELQQAEKHIEDEVNGHEIFDVEITKTEQAKYEYQTLDLYPITPIRLARGEAKVKPAICIKGWNNAFIHYADPQFACKDNIFITDANLQRFRKKNKAFDEAFKKLTRQKPGPKPDKLNDTIARITDDLNSGKYSLKGLKKLDQDSLAREYGVSRNTAVKALKEVSNQKNCQS